jgi:hypothetical protein
MPHRPHRAPATGSPPTADVRSEPVSATANRDGNTGNYGNQVAGFPGQHAKTLKFYLRLSFYRKCSTPVYARTSIQIATWCSPPATIVAAWNTSWKPNHRADGFGR